MRILSLLWGFSLGGGGKYTTIVARLNGYYDLQISTVCIYGKNWGCDLKPLKDISASLVPIKSRADLSWIERCCDLIANTKPDIVFVHGFNGPIVARACQRRMKKRFPFVCSYHGLYHPPKLSRVPLSPIFNRSAEYLYKHYALGIVSVCSYSKKYLVSKGVPEHKIVVIHNGIPDERRLQTSLTRTQVGLRNGDFAIGVASRLDPVKGLEYLIEAFPEILKKEPKAKLVLLGNGPSEKRLRARCRRLNIAQAVLFAGYQSNVDPWLNLIDLFTLPSLHEYHSIGLLEAMRAGLPIVATDVGGNPESIEHGKHGYLVPPRDSKALESGICKLAKEPDLRKRLGKAARQRFERDFTQERTLERTASWLLGFRDQVVNGR